MKLNSFSEYLFLERLYNNNKNDSTWILVKFANLMRLPFSKWDAYRVGIIDNQGNVLRQPETDGEYRFFGAFENLVRKIKKAIVKYVGNGSMLQNLVTLYVVKSESVSRETSLIRREIAMELDDKEIELLEDILVNLKKMKLVEDSMLMTGDESYRTATPTMMSWDS